MRIEKISTVVSAFLALAITVSLFALPLVNATNPPKTWPTVAFLSVAPNPIGVGQTALFIMWIDKAHPLSQGIYGDRFSGYTINLTKPDGTTQILGPFTADAISSAVARFTPDQVGNYTAVFTFPAQLIKEVNPPPAYQSYNHPDQINDTYGQSTSNSVTLVVTETPIADFPETPLPTDYWTRPINALNRNWAQIAGNWLGGAHIASNFNPYSQGPETPHVLWARSLGLGGIAGDTAGASSYLTTTASSGRPSPLILNGILFLEDRAPVNRNWGWYAVDLYTGETLYYNTERPYPSFASVLNFDSLSAHGTWGYLWSTTGSGTSAVWIALDPFTGNNIFNITNPQTAGTAVYGKDGSILRYNIAGSGANKRLTVWNTTRVTSPISITGDPTRPYTYSGNYSGLNGFSLNVSIPDVQGSILEVIEDKWVVGGVAGKQNQTHIEPGHIWKLNLQPGQEGTLISNVTFTPPKAAMDVTELYYYGPYTGTPGVARMQGPLVFSEYDVFVFWEGATRQLWGFSISTGQMLWGPTEPQDPWMMYGNSPTAAYGILYTSRYQDQSPGGQISAYNITTGENLWNYLPGTTGFETYYTNTPTAISVIADGKIYTISQEHSPSMPLRRDATITCLDAFTGEVLWKVSSYMRAQLAISDGYLVGSNLYDNKWYVYGKGPSATTIEGPGVVQPLGTPILLKGTVTDQSPGAPNTPAIADENQQAWMEYLYMQQSKPSDAKGVIISIDVLDPNGNFVHIENVTSDASGFFSSLFTPEVPGKYTVIASFAGSKSYGSSSAQTAIAVSEAEATTAPTQAPQSIADMYFIPAVAGIIIVIIVGFALLAILTLRKRP